MPLGGELAGLGVISDADAAADHDVAVRDAAVDGLHTLGLVNPSDDAAVQRVRDIVVVLERTPDPAGQISARTDAAGQHCPGRPSCRCRVQEPAVQLVARVHGHDHAPRREPEAQRVRLLEAEVRERLGLAPQRDAVQAEAPHERVKNWPLGRVDAHNVHIRKPVCEQQAQKSVTASHIIDRAKWLALPGIMGKCSDLAVGLQALEQLLDPQPVRARLGSRRKAEGDLVAACTKCQGAVARDGLGHAPRQAPQHALGVQRAGAARQCPPAREQSVEGILASPLSAPMPNRLRWGGEGLPIGCGLPGSTWPCRSW
mmetsp:Transcript_101317/g.312484  ORF Transcript_101317/g.312484 Transcript_101317/m.312484 type:complete len:314 (+) Transcript_101317:127-1068(+)